MPLAESKLVRWPIYTWATLDPALQDRAQMQTALTQFGPPKSKCFAISAYTTRGSRVQNTTTQYPIFGADRFRRFERGRGVCSGFVHVPLRQALESINPWNSECIGARQVFVELELLDHTPYITPPTPSPGLWYTNTTNR